MSFKKTMLYIVAFIFVFGIGLSFSEKDVYAEDVSVVIGISPDGEIAVGDTVTATVIINGDNIASYSISLLYTTGILEYQSEAEDSGTIAISGTGATTISYTFTAVGEGRAAISTSGDDCYDAEGNLLTVAHAGANLTVGKTEEEKEEKEEKEEDPEDIKIGTEHYTLVNEYHLPEPPEGYTLSSVHYNDREMFAYQAPNQNIKVVCLQNVDAKQKWFVFDEDTQSFSPFIEYSLEGVKYVIINKPDDVTLPEGFTENSLTLDNTQFTAYSGAADTGMYLVYAINVRGEAGFYYYDTDEGSFTRYDAIKSLLETATAQDAGKAGEKDKNADTQEKAGKEVKYATPLIADEKKDTNDEEGLISRETLKRLLMMMIVLFIIMCIVVIILVIRTSILQNQLYDDEDEEDEEDEDEDLYQKAVRDAKLTASLEEQAEKESGYPGKNKVINRNKSYAVNEDTGEILLEEAQDNNAGVNVPPAEDKETSKIEDAMKERPFGIDSAFNVASPEEVPQGENVYVEKERESDVVNQEMVDKVRKQKTEKLEAEEKEANSRLENQSEELTENQPEDVLEGRSEPRVDSPAEAETDNPEVQTDNQDDNQNKEQAETTQDNKQKETIQSEEESEDKQEYEDNKGNVFKKKKRNRRHKKYKKDKGKAEPEIKASGMQKPDSLQNNKQPDKLDNNTDNKPETDKSKKVVLPGGGDEEE